MKYAILILILITFTACSQTSSPNPGQQEKMQGYHTHVISSHGETLSAISRWYTGSVNNWKVIASHNPGLNEKKLRVGNAIHIPLYLVRNKTAMPKKAPSSRAATGRADASVVENDIASTAEIKDQPEGLTNNVKDSDFIEEVRVVEAKEIQKEATTEQAMSESSALQETKAAADREKLMAEVEQANRKAIEESIAAAANAQRAAEAAAASAEKVSGVHRTQQHAEDLAKEAQHSAKAQADAAMAVAEEAKKLAEAAAEQAKQAQSQAIHDLQSARE